MIDWTKRKLGPAEPPPLDLETMVPAGHPLRDARTALDAALADATLEVETAEQRLGTLLANLRDDVLGGPTTAPAGL